MTYLGDCGCALGLTLFATLLNLLPFFATLGFQQRDELVILVLLVFSDVITQETEFGVRLHALVMLRGEFRQHLLIRLAAVVSGWLDARPGQGIVQCALAKFVRLTRAGKRNIRNHTAILRGATIDAEELVHGQLQLAINAFAGTCHAVQIEQVLHRALAVGWLSDDQCAAVILQCGSENFRRRGAVAIHQHRHRTGPDHTRLAIFMHRYPIAIVLDLHHRPLVDEQAGQRIRFRQ